MTDVPIAPGVPSVPDPNTAPGPSLLTSDAPGIAQYFVGPQWGIFDQAHKPVIVGNSTIEVNYDEQWRVADYPVEQGAFASYNKVQTPFDVKFTFAQAGNVGKRSAFLAQVEAALASLYLFTVVTPEVSYPNANLVRQSYRRTQKRGATLISLDVWVRQIRQAPSPAFSNTQAPPSQDPVQDGTVQPQVTLGTASWVTTPQ